MPVYKRTVFHNPMANWSVGTQIAKARVHLAQGRRGAYDSNLGGSLTLGHKQELRTWPVYLRVAGENARTARETCAIYWMLLAKGRLTRQRFGAMLGGIALLRVRMG